MKYWSWINHSNHTIKKKNNNNKERNLDYSKTFYWVYCSMNWQAHRTTELSAQANQPINSYICTKTYKIPHPTNMQLLGSISSTKIRLFFICQSDLLLKKTFKNSIKRCCCMLQIENWTDYNGNAMGGIKQMVFFCQNTQYFIGTIKTQGCSWGNID